MDIRYKGVYQDDGFFLTIEKDYKISQGMATKLSFRESCCEHAHSFRIEEQYDIAGRKKRVLVATIPFMIVLRNDNGDHSSILCAECITKFLVKLKSRRITEDTSSVKRFIGLVIFSWREFKQLFKGR